MKYSLLIINGPNINMLGMREPNIYGSETLNELENSCKILAAKMKISVRFFHSNEEGQLINVCQKAGSDYNAIIINAGGYTHTSIALRDALVISGLPIYEVHISNIHAREQFRHSSFITPIAVGMISGMGIIGYELAMEAAVRHLECADI